MATIYHAYFIVNGGLTKYLTQSSQFLFKFFTFYQAERYQAENQDFYYCILFQIFLIQQQAYMLKFRSICLQLSQLSIILYQAQILNMFKSILRYQNLNQDNNAYFIQFNKIYIIDKIQINSANKIKIQISQFNNKIDQQTMDQLEQRIRRSSRLKDTSTFRQLLAYASMVRDEDQVFSFMEENKIGIGQPQFWAAKLRMLKNKCQYTEFIKVIKQINKKHELKKHPKYWLITEIQNQLQLYLQRMLRKKSKVKRSAKQYELLNYSNIEKQTRKFGKIQVYVDPDCRMQYRLEDLVQFVTNRMMEQCQIQKNCYERQINSRPLSFIGKSKERINKLTQQIFGFKQRIQTQNNARKTAGRLSIVGRKSNKRDFEGIQTPDFKKKSFSKESRHKKKINKQNLNMLDSIQILKNTRIRSISKKNSQGKYQQQQNPEFDALLRDSSYKKQKIRNSPGKSQSAFSEPDMEIGHNSLFSFGNSAQKISSSDRKQNRLSINKIKRIRHIQKRQQQINSNQSSKDYAFIQLQQTQPQGLLQKHKNNNKQSLDLQNAIKQIQMQKYQSQTFSQIDSNKQNNILLAEQDSVNLNIYGIQNIGRGTQQIDYKQRKKFETLKKQKQSYLKNNKKLMKKQEKFQLNSSADQSSQILYKQLLLYLDQQSQQSKESINLLSISEKNNKKNKKRISRISQQRSYSFSQTRPHSRSNT